MGFPGSSDGKVSACNTGDQGFIPGLKRSPGEGNGYPLPQESPVFLSGEFHEERSLAGYRPWGPKESDKADDYFTDEHFLSLVILLSRYREGDGDFSYKCNCLLLLVFSCPVMSDSLPPHGLHHARPPCPTPSPEVCLSSCPLHQWCYPAISSSDTLFSFCPQSFPALGTFLMSHLFAKDDQTTGASALASVLPVNIQGSSPLTGLISLLSKGLSEIFSSTRVQRHQFFGFLPSLWSSSHNHTWPLGRP